MNPEETLASLADEFAFYNMGLVLFNALGYCIEGAEGKLNALTAILEVITMEAEKIKADGKVTEEYAVVLAFGRCLRAVVAVEYGLPVYETYDEREDEDEDYEG